MPAKQAVAVDHLSRRRLELGLGAGWFVEEYEVFGLDFPEPKELVDRYTEAIALVDRYLTHDQASFEGAHCRLDGAYNRPAPVQRPRPPLVMGAQGPRMPKLVARYADTRNSFALPDELRRRNDQLTAYCEEIGRDPGTLKRSMFYGANQARDDRSWPSTDAVEHYIGRYTEVGMQEFIPQPPTLDRLHMVERIATDVLPRLRRKPLADSEANLHSPEDRSIIDALGVQTITANQLVKPALVDSFEQSLRASVPLNHGHGQAGSIAVRISIAGCRASVAWYG